MNVKVVNQQTGNIEIVSLTEAVENPNLQILTKSTPLFTTADAGRILARTLPKVSGNLVHDKRIANILAAPADQKRGTR